MHFHAWYRWLLLLAYGRRVVLSAPAQLPRWRSPGIILGGCALSSFVLCWVLSIHNFDWAFYLMPSRLWQLTSGAILFHWQARTAMRAYTAGMCVCIHASMDALPLDWHVCVRVYACMHARSSIASTRLDLVLLNLTWLGSS